MGDAVFSVRDVQFKCGFGFDGFQTHCFPTRSPQNTCFEPGDFSRLTPQRSSRSTVEQAPVAPVTFHNDPNPTDCGTTLIKEYCDLRVISLRRVTGVEAFLRFAYIQTRVRGIELVGLIPTWELFAKVGYYLKAFSGMQQVPPWT